MTRHDAFPTDAARTTSAPSFWNTRYATIDALFGTGPSAFVARHAGWIPPKSAVVDLGAGEARTSLWLARMFGHRVTAVDFSETALATARQRANAGDVPFQPIVADLRTWRPHRRWDAALISFLHLLPNERIRLYTTIRRMLRPGGVLLVEAFAPAHLNGGCARIGPSRKDRMITPGELSDAFAGWHRVRCDVHPVALHESKRLWGRAAVTQFIGRAPSRRT